jgi:hypothetical protein
MPADEKTLERIAKLLRLAAPSSGTTDAERESAALEVARLFEEHDIDLGAAVSRPRVQQEAPRKVSPHAWVLTIALQYCNCEFCNTPISRGDAAWVRVMPGARVLYRHNYSPCALA